MDIFENGFYDKQHKIFKEFILYKTKKNLKEILIILPNLFFRLINLIFFLISIIGIVIFYKSHKDNNEIIEIINFIITIFSYVNVILISSLALGYDRYRLPIEPIIFIFFIYLLSYTKNTIYRKNLC
jgi:hypothetical protein